MVTLVGCDGVVKAVGGALKIKDGPPTGLSVTDGFISFSSWRMKGLSRFVSRGMGLTGVVIGGGVGKGEGGGAE